MAAFLSQASLFKHAKREDVVEFAPVVLNQLSSCGLSTSDNTLLRKLNIKLAQVPKWVKSQPFQALDYKAVSPASWYNLPEDAGGVVAIPAW